ncbi:hypothetical protein EYF80_061854 [Liparis tanakae]|uniref:Uncharacterized protein n=1 Tax=Liparis tanakae TaxID=230148 RepID=A0A4Z2EGK4_9TELE|nr:hypothetical protein EYF80_061854 [Liparis tanakae]
MSRGTRASLRHGDVVLEDQPQRHSSPPRHWIEKKTVLEGLLGRHQQQQQQQPAWRQRARHLSLNGLDRTHGDRLQSSGAQSPVSVRTHRAAHAAWRGAARCVQGPQ